MYRFRFGMSIREDVKIPTYKPHTNHKRSSVRSHTLAQTSICDLSHSLCWRPLINLGHIISVTHICHPLWFVCGHRKDIFGISPLSHSHVYAMYGRQSSYFDDHELSLEMHDNDPLYLHAYIIITSVPISTKKTHKFLKDIAFRR